MVRKKCVERHPQGLALNTYKQFRGMVRKNCVEQMTPERNNSLSASERILWIVKKRVLLWLSPLHAYTLTPVSVS